MTNKKENGTIQERKPVPVFFAADDKYMPFLGVTLASLKKHAAEEYAYQIHVLYTGELGEHAKRIEEMQTENIRVSFYDVSENLAQIQKAVHCRDYYTSAIYFRLFIPQLFPQYDKAVYLDCDIVLCADIAKLYEIGLGENYVGAVADQVITSNATFGEYTKYALGIEPKKYFNSGVLVMNLKKLREIGFYRQFTQVLRSYDFIVAPDQDCLNLICKDKVHYYGMDWNRMPIGGKKDCKPKLVHYNLSMKPWHYDGVLYENLFWETAKETPFLQWIEAKKNAFTPEMAKKDERDGANLLALAQAEADSPYNYFRTRAGIKNSTREIRNEGGRYGFIDDFKTASRGVKAD